MLPVCFDDGIDLVLQRVTNLDEDDQQLFDIATQCMELVQRRMWLQGRTIEDMTHTVSESTSNEVGCSLLGCLCCRRCVGL